jgi:hypothetical protein
MSDAHKEALAEGRTQSRVVRAYLEALEAHRPRPGRKRTEESVRRRLTAVEKELQSAETAFERLSLLQERIDLKNELETMSTGNGLAELEDAFVAVAKSYGERKGITHAVWTEVGVPSGVLKRAGITRRS